jgi:hypothetical protein
MCGSKNGKDRSVSETLRSGLSTTQLTRDSAHISINNNTRSVYLQYFHQLLHYTITHAPVMSTLPSLHVTPPERFTSSPPLTLPPTSEKASRIVNRIVTEIKAREAGHSSLTEPWVVYPLSKDQYGELLREIQKDETLLGYVKQKLRYVSRYVRDSK